MRQGIRVAHGRPFHPQTRGKDERFHRRLRAEVLQGREFADLAACQRAFDPWREVDNHQRPHEALDLAVPATRDTARPRAYQASPAAWEYGPDVAVRKVSAAATISFRGREYRVGKAFVGQSVGVQPLDADGHWRVLFCRSTIHELNLHEPQYAGGPVSIQPVTHVSEHLSPLSPVYTH